MSVVSPSVTRSGTESLEILEVVGNFTPMTVASLEREMDLIGERVGLIVDLSRCDHIDSAGLELLRAKSVTAGRNAQFFSVVGASGSVARMIDFIDRAGVISRMSSLEGARAAAPAPARIAATAIAA